MTVALRDMRDYIIRKAAFKGSSVYAHWVDAIDGSKQYVVYSYGIHFPMYVFAPLPDGSGAYCWYGNSDKYSPTTSRHQSACRPPHIHAWGDTRFMCGLTHQGMLGLVKLRMEGFHCGEMQRWENVA